MDEKTDIQFDDTSADEISYAKLFMLLTALVLLMTSPLLFSSNTKVSEQAGTLLVELPVDQQPLAEEENQTESSVVGAVPDTSELFDHLSLQAESVFVWDVNAEKSLYAKNPTTQLPLASLTKVMTALTASSFIRDDEYVVVSETALDTEGDSGLLANESWRFKDLRDYMLIVSSNDGANVIARAALPITNTSSSTNSTDEFVKKMNQIAKDLELTQTYFLNETGLDPSSTTAGGYGSARDVARLMEYLLKYHPEILSGTTNYQDVFISLDEFSHAATNTNTLIPNIPVLLGSKTGYTDLAGGNLAIVFNADLNRPIVAVVLGSTLEGRFEDMKNIVDTVLNK